MWNAAGTDPGINDNLFNAVDVSILLISKRACERTCFFTRLFYLALLGIAFCESVCYNK